MNRTILTSLAAIFSAVLASAQTDTPTDTVTVIKDPTHITITDNGSTTSITVSGTADDPDFNFRYSVSSADTTAMHIPAGISFPYLTKESERYSSRKVVVFSDIYSAAIFPYHAPEAVRTSVEAGVDQLIGYRYNFWPSGASLGFGAGFGTKQFTIRRGMTPAWDNDCLTLITAPEGARDVRSKLLVWNIRIPFYYQQRIYRSLAFRLTAMLNFNVSARAYTKYHIDDISYSQKVKSLHQRLLTPEFRFDIGSSDFGSVYVSWSPVSLFKRCYGPQIKTLALGVSLPF